MTRGSILGLGAALVLVACGGSTDSALIGPSSGGSGATTGGGSGSGSSGGADGGASGASVGGAAGSVAVGGNGGSAAGGSGGYTLEDVCQKTAPIGCALDQPCCTQSGFGFDQNGCVQAAVDSCMKDVAEVKAGTMKFDPSGVDACIANLKPYLQECVIKSNEMFPLFDALAPCQSIWIGTLPAGAACERDEQCAPTGDPYVFVSCDDTSKTCRHFARLGLNQPCELSDNAPGACDTGLYCDAALIGVPPYQGMCRAATAIGAPCNTFKPYNLECGFGFYCNQSTGVCTSAKIGGASCAETVECQTLTCTLGQCAAQKPLVQQATCTG
jgi:hypothetical protein